MSPANGLQRVNLGFMPLLDCATLVVAAEKSFGAAEGLDLRLSRETSWANIRDRVVVGHFDAAQMLGPMVVAATLGLGHIEASMMAPISLGLGGNAITVSGALWSAMSAQGALLGADPHLQGTALARVVQARARAGHAPLTFAMVYPFSCHNYELRYWFSACGLHPDRDVRLVVLPPPLLVDALRCGQVDGFCVGEPWSSLAVEAGIGCIAAVGSDIWKLGPEKVLGCRSAWAERHPQLLAALIRAVYRAALWCDEPANHDELARLLSEPRYVGAPANVLRATLAGRLPFAQGAAPLARPDFLVFARHHATLPWKDHAAWFYGQMVLWGQTRHSSASYARAVQVFRPDLYAAALHETHPDLSLPDIRPAELGQFFDARPFDPGDLRSYLATFPAEESVA